MKDKKYNTGQSILNAERRNHKEKKDSGIKDEKHEGATCRQERTHEPRLWQAAKLQVVQGVDRRRISELQTQLADAQRSQRTAQQLAAYLSAELNKRAVARPQRELIAARNEAMRLRVKYEEEKEARLAAESMLQQLLVDLDHEAEKRGKTLSAHKEPRDAIVFPPCGPVWKAEGKN